MNRNLVGVLMGFAVMMLCMSGCGGGGDSTSSSQTPVGTTVNITTFSNVYTGKTTDSSFNFPSLVGTDSQGRSWTGSFNLVADGTTTFEGNSVTKSRALTTLHLSGGTPVSSISTRYFLVTDGSVYKVAYSSGVTYVPTSLTPLPTNPKVGDFGNIGTFTGNDGTTTIVTWSLNADFNGASILALSTITKTGSVVTGNEVDSFYLDANGIPTKVIFSATVNGSTITLSGNRS